MRPEGDLKSVWVVVPAYQEAARLGGTLRLLCEDGRGRRDVVVVDDGSTDSTSRVAEAFPVWVLRHVVNRGQGAALRTGMRFALERGAQVVVTFDADGQHDAAEIDGLTAPVIEGRVEVALGSRFLGRAIGMPPLRRALLRMASALTRIGNGLAVTDAHNGLRAFRADALRRMSLTEDGMAHASEILDQIAALRLSFCEVPVTIRYTAETLEKGQTSMEAARSAGERLLGRWIR